MKVCRICMQSINHSFEDSLLFLFHPKLSLCSDCLNKFHPEFIKFKLGEIEGLAIYKYDDWIAKLLHQYKEKNDLALASLFLDLFAFELKAKFHQYVLIPMPSSEEKKAQRGFDHLREMFKCLKLPFLDILEKKQSFKQEKARRKERWENRFDIECHYSKSLSNKSVLLIDDVMTTGATLKRAIELISKLHPKRIKILVMSKNEGKRR